MKDAFCNGRYHFVFSSESERFPGRLVLLCKVPRVLAHAFTNLGVNQGHSRSDYKYSLSSFGIHDFY